MLYRAALFTSKACATIRDEVYALRRYWTRRQVDRPSFTLGAASYLDIPQGGIHAYRTTIVRTRRRLEATFAELYAQVRAGMSAHLETERVDYHPELALPGFHIFEAHPAFARPKIHFDLQHRYFEWTDPRFEQPSHRRTFTVAVALPHAGAGLNLWPLSSEVGEAMAEADRVAWVAKTAPTYEAYQLGELVVHTGDQLHQIAGSTASAPDDVRLTLQGHAQREDEQWWLYW